MSSKLSIVLTGRNDNHSAGFEDRLSTALAFNLKALKSAGIDVEIVWVEWNAVPDKPLLAEQILRNYSNARAWVVGPELHARLCEKPNMRFMQYFAKNVGIRQARGPWVLVTNGDILLGANTLETMARLITGGRPCAVYRATRRDLREGIGPAGAADPANWQRLNLTTPPCHIEQSGDFILCRREVFAALRGFNEAVRNSELHVDAQFCIQAYQTGFAVELIGDVSHLFHPGSWTHLPAAERENAAGSFGAHFDFLAGLPYVNSHEWGLACCALKPVADRVIRLVMPDEAVMSEYLKPVIRPSTDLLREGERLWYQARKVSLEAFRAEFASAVAGLPRPGSKAGSLAVPFLKRYLQELWKNLLTMPACREKGVALYGAGRHTRWLLNVVRAVPGPAIRLILDDYTEGDSRIEEIPVIRPDASVPGRVGAVVISSDVYEEVLTRRSREQFGDCLPIVRLYEGLPAGLYFEETF